MKQNICQRLKLIHYNPIKKNITGMPVKTRLNLIVVVKQGSSNFANVNLFKTFPENLSDRNYLVLKIL